jgi:branched-chain amino acid transport system ATP-binding protein
VIREFMHRPASTLSGGQQQMVSIGRALLSRPRILLMDEPSIGLAPKLFQDLLAPIRTLQQREGLSILLVEQNVREALKISDRVVVMKSGQMIWEGMPEALSDNEKLMELY